MGAETATMEDVYSERNALAIAFAKAALSAGWAAGRGVDTSREPGDPWANVVYVSLPSGDQLSWHIAPDQVSLLDGLPFYPHNWDGTFLSRDPMWPSRIR